MLFSECMFLLPCTRQSLHFYFSLLFALSDFNLCFKPKKISGFVVVVLECNVYILKHFFHIIVYTIHSLYVTLEHKSSLKACTHRDEYRRTLFASVFQRVFCVHTQAIFADDEPSEHANSFPDIRWRLM